MSCCLKPKKSKVGVQLPTTFESSKQRNDKLYYDFLAPSVYHLETAFLHEIKEAGLDEQTCTIYDIENLRDNENFGVIRSKGKNVSCPIDGEAGCAYVHAIGAGEESTAINIEEHVGTANYMLSYAWGYKCIDIVDTLVEFCEDKDLDTKKTFIWICCLCNNQHRIGNNRVVAFEEFQDIFQTRVKGIKNILAMMTPWNNPGYLKRVWCIFEAYNANADEDCTITIIMPPRDQDSLIEAVQTPTDESGKSGLDELFEALENTNVENAQASSQSDKDNIIQLVKDGPGIHGLNVEINHLLRTWIRDTVFIAAKEKEDSLVSRNEEKEDENANSDMERRNIATFLTFCASFFSRVGGHKEALDLHGKALEAYETLEDKHESKELMARCYNNMGTEHESMGKYEDALEMHQKCREAFEDIYGTDHPNTSVSYFNIGAVYGKLLRNEEALEMYNKSLEIDKRVHGEEHIDVASSYTYIGRVLQKMEDYDGALEMFQKSLSIREKTFGKKHPDAAIGYGDVGLLYHMRKDYDSAIEMHKKSLAIQERNLGKYHPDTASVYQNLGGAYYETGDNKKALDLVKKAYNAYLRTFGKDHPKTDTSRQWVEIVEEAIQNEQMQQ